MHFMIKAKRVKKKLYKRKNIHTTFMANGLVKSDIAFYAGDILFGRLIGFI